MSVEWFTRCFYKRIITWRNGRQAFVPPERVREIVEEVKQIPPVKTVNDALAGMRNKFLRGKKKKDADDAADDPAYLDDPDDPDDAPDAPVHWDELAPEAPRLPGESAEKVSL